MSPVTLVRVPVQATVPTQPFGHIVFEVEHTLSIAAAENAHADIRMSLSALRAFEAADWLPVVPEVDHAPIEIAP